MYLLFWKSYVFEVDLQITYILYGLKEETPIYHLLVFRFHSIIFRRCLSEINLKVDLTLPILAVFVSREVIFFCTWMSKTYISRKALTRRLQSRIYQYLLAVKIFPMCLLAKESWKSTIFGSLPEFYFFSILYTGN